MSRKVEVTSYRPQWREQYLQEKKRLETVFQGTNAVIHHIGSTSVEGLAAKPIIDFLIEITDIGAADDRTDKLEALGYVGKGENGIACRRYFFFENKEGERLYHVHIFASGSEDIERHLLFRDYLRMRKNEAEKYGRLKSELAAKYPNDIEAYIEGKKDFVQELEMRALKWARSR
ncbi:GrpB family protein [Rossellomorea vietnamensis]|uniref:GrpB family protein n=1 Tax=Rossellomorea aquimaris TaxID=189382 RepID=A0A5D4TPY4_9BACI|nr:GrpB family protein [Rossellomorea aquimaris]TYS76314.1 GrpB family protein [Rossellomorea aquimaris]